MVYVKASDKDILEWMLVNVQIWVRCTQHMPLVHAFMVVRILAHSKRVA